MDEMRTGAPPSFGAWLEQLAAIAAQGLHYTDNPYDRDRFEQLADLVKVGSTHWGPQALERVLDEVVVDSRGYWTPKIEVRTIVSNESAVLMVKESDDGGWSFPGGWLEVGCSPAEGAIKEVYEETGLTIQSVELVTADEQSVLGCVPGFPWHVVKMVFRANMPLREEPSPVHSHEIDEAVWKDKSVLHRLRLSDKRTSPEMIDMAVRGAWQCSLFDM